MLGLIENWFHPVRASQDYQRQDYFLLFLIVAVGTWLRFWHLGNVGLHGDEDIMALAARGIVEQGSPILPSGMYYERVLLHSYVLAWSTMLFGDNEWALRLPSAIVGSLCGLLAFFMGRRFLDPKPSIALVAVMTFLPAMIDVATDRTDVRLLRGQPDGICDPDISAGKETENCCRSRLPAWSGCWHTICRPCRSLQRRCSCSRGWPIAPGSN